MRQEPIIRVKDLHYSFREGEGMKEVLHGVSADFYPGEIVIIMGPSGSGKTTFLKLLGGLRTVQKGSIEIDGQQLEKGRKEDLVQVRRKIGFIFQNHHLIASLSVAQNVMMPLSFNPKETARSARPQALDILKQVGLSEHVEKKPSQLSGGQKQRVAIARALVHQPRIVLADEPTASLDGKTGREVVDHIHRLAKQSGATILLVTHDSRILDVADRIIELEDGILNPDPPVSGQA
ncbi:MAG: ATP-binding cassette domain-containing protein [Verrucomicrobiota bacterium JB024]|nr:ATP-binding cassette domain-containing protein [Verrucomicrobiota bacterium JB024]